MFVFKRAFTLLGSIIIIFLMGIISLASADDSYAYTVTYYGNENTGGTVPVDKKIYNSNDIVRVARNSGNLTKENYVFGGWKYYRGEIEEIIYKATGRDSFKITNDVNLHAIWNKITPITKPNKEVLYENGPVNIEGWPKVEKNNEKNLIIRAKINKKGVGYFAIFGKSIPPKNAGKISPDFSIYFAKNTHNIILLNSVDIKLLTASWEKSKYPSYSYNLPVRPIASGSFSLEANIETTNFLIPKHATLDGAEWYVFFVAEDLEGNLQKNPEKFILDADGKVIKPSKRNN